MGTTMIGRARRAAAMLGIAGMAAACATAPPSGGGQAGSGSVVVQRPATAISAAPSPRRIEAARSVYAFAVRCRVRADVLRELVLVMEERGGVQTVRQADARDEILGIANFVRAQSNRWVTRSSRVLGYSQARRRADYQREIRRLSAEANRPGATQRLARQAGDCRRRYAEFERLGL